MIDAEFFRQQPILGSDHVAIPVVRKLRAQSIARLTGSAGTDSVGKNYEVRRGIEQVSRSEQLTGETRREKPASASSGAVENEYRIGDGARRVPAWRSECRVMNSQLRKDRPFVEAEVAHDEVALLADS